MQNAACQCPLARLVTLKVDWSLWQDPNLSVTDVTRSDRLKGNLSAGEIIIIKTIIYSLLFYYCLLFLLRAFVFL